MQNIEIKAQCADRISQSLHIERIKAAGATFIQTMQQIDTYFQSSRGRLKLREWHDDLGQQGAELIGYLRPDIADSRRSEYYRAAAFDSQFLLKVLETTLGLLVVVRKNRLLYLIGSTRIHFDDVEDLGYFIELETVLPEHPTPEQVAAAQTEHQWVISLLDLSTLTIMEGSYSDLILSRV